MSDNENSRRPQHPQQQGGWQPVPQGGEYDAEATAFVRLPEDMMGLGEPLAAPGHGYVPPVITPLTPAAGTDPSATGTWAMPEAVRWPEPAAHDPRATGQWNFTEAEPEPGSGGTGSDLTGQWTIPVAGGDLPEESGEFTTSALAAHWGASAPATLPGGATAPWATPGAAEGQPSPWARPQGSPGEHPGEPAASPPPTGHWPSLAALAEAEHDAEAAPEREREPRGSEQRAGLYPAHPQSEHTDAEDGSGHPHSARQPGGEGHDGEQQYAEDGRGPDGEVRDGEVRDGEKLYAGDGSGHPQGGRRSD
ncbi:hypothetical protein NLX86_31610, partial [Streptomyces sp. A3M-1-3]|nr:hypothetical protein [Streptomyces sp. A3M-1-3]